MPSRVSRLRVWGATACFSSAMSATSTGSRITPARPIAPSPSRIGAARTASKCSAVIWYVALAWKVCVASSNS